MEKRRVIHGVIRPGLDAYDVYMAECVELAVVTQGRTLSETLSNLKEAMALYLERENRAELSLSQRLRLRLTVHLPGEF